MFCSSTSTQTPRRLQISVCCCGSHKLDRARDREIDRLLIEGMGRHLQEMQIVDLTFGDRQEVSAAGVGNRRRPRIRFVLARNQCVASVEGFRATVPRREDTPDFVHQEVPGDRLMRLLVAIAHNGDEKLALYQAFIHGLSSPKNSSTPFRLYQRLTYSQL